MPLPENAAIPSAPPDLSPFWTEPRIQAALDVALDIDTDEEIADRAGISKRQLERWKLVPEFAARVYEHLCASYASCQQTGLATRERRVQHLERRHAAICRIIRERGEDLDGECAGSDTGLIVKRKKGIGGIPVTEYLIDGGLLAELRAIEEQIAREVGHRQASVKHDLTGGALDLLREFLSDGNENLNVNPEEPGSGEAPVEVGAA